MNQAKGILKGGWHPKNDPKLTSKTEMKNAVSSLRGHNTDATPASNYSNHSSMPLSSMRDPESFGPPPQHRAKRDVDGASPPAGGHAALSSTASSMGSSSTQRPAPPVPGRSGLASSQAQSQQQRPQQQQPEQQQQQQQQQLQQRPYEQPQQPIHQEEPEPAPAPSPFRTNTTGIDPNIYAKPPSHHAKRPVDPTRTSSSTSPGPSTITSRSPPPVKPSKSAAPAVSSKPKPQLPPRLPPRRAQPQQGEEAEEAPPSYTEVTGRSHAGNSPPASATSYFPAQQQEQGHGQSGGGAAGGGYINTQAAQRLGAAGVNVPGFNIGGGSEVGAEASQQQSLERPQHPPSRATNTSSFGAGTGQMSELQSRFARMKPAADGGENSNLGSTPVATNSAPSPPPPARAQGAQAAQGKRAPPPPPKRAITPGSSGNAASSVAGSTAAGGGQEPPPVPMASKPR
ncbi:MAG: hypothetical protein M1831_005974 [Alyxoria varia]|nr:MAG: hypothetical protein M1831_005974 [Alyxoria varia]